MPRRTMNFCFLFGEEHPRQIFAICASITTNSRTFRIVMHLAQLHFCQGKQFKTSTTAGHYSRPYSQDLRSYTALSLFGHAPPATPVMLMGPPLLLEHTGSCSHIGDFEVLRLTPADGAAPLPHLSPERRAGGVSIAGLRSPARLMTFDSTVQRSIRCIHYHILSGLTAGAWV